MDFPNGSTSYKSSLLPTTQAHQSQVNFEINPTEKAPSFTDMLNSEFYSYEEFATATQTSCFSQDLDEEESVDGTKLKTSQKTNEKRPRTKNFTKQEDELLISAWQNISLDPITGADQTSGNYWQRVQNYYLTHKDFQSNRNASSLRHRWSMIQLAVNKFQGFYNQVDGRSGYSEIDKIACAKEMYKKVCKANFCLEHCWNLLRHMPKWNNDFATKKPKSQKETPLISSPSDCVLLESSEFERPIGRKAAKEMEKKRKRPGNGSNDGVAILEQIRADQLESRKKRNEQLNEMIQLAKESNEREKRREAKEQDEIDAKIMAMDTSSMGAIEVEYFNLRKQEIIEKKRAQLAQ